MWISLQSQGSCRGGWISLLPSGRPLNHSSSNVALDHLTSYMQDPPICCYLPGFAALSSPLIHVSPVPASWQMNYSVYTYLIFFFLPISNFAITAPRIHPAVTPVLMSLPGHASSSYISFQPLSTADLNNARILWGTWERREKQTAESWCCMRACDSSCASRPFAHTMHGYK